MLYLQPRKGKWFGALAQSVEQQTENLCVPGSIPGGTTKPTQASGFFVFSKFVKSTQTSSNHFIARLSKVG